MSNDDFKAPALYAGQDSARVTFDPKTGYDLTAARYMVLGTDPYAEQAAFYEQMGRRFPNPYQAKAMEIAMETEAFYRGSGSGSLDLGPRNAILTGAEIAGRRTTHWRTTGSRPDRGSVAEWGGWTARDWFGYAPDGARGPGTSVKWDSQEYRRRTSGVIRQRRKFDQQVYHDRPWLTLRASGGSADVRITVGVSNGGAETVRRFFLGGGFTASFLIDQWDYAKVNVIDVEGPRTEVDFAWVKQGMQAGDQTLYFPERLPDPVGGPTTLTVPEGAFAVFAEIADPLWAWNNPLIAGHSMVVGILSNVDQRVLGSTYTFSVANDIVWLLRPI